MRRFSWAGLFGVLVAMVAAVLVAAVAASAASAGPVPVPVSGNPSPFDTSACAAVDAAQTSAISGLYNYLNAEVEPMVAVDPTDPQHLIGAWQQDRWADGGANGLVSAYSTNGGTTWSESSQPFTSCAGGLDYQRASDPWVSIGPGKADGSCSIMEADCSTAYAISLSFNETNASEAIAAAVSDNSGASWTHTQPLISDPCGVKPPGYGCNPKAFLLDDKESVTADPTQPGTAYAVWDRLAAPPASFPGYLFEFAYKGPTWISRTTDYGRTWSAPQQIVTTPSIDQTIGNVIVVDPTSGTLYDFFAWIHNLSNAHHTRGTTIAFVKSTDHGLTWGSPQVVAADPAIDVADAANLDPSTNAAPALLRTGGALPEPAVSPSGQLYVAWEGLDPASGQEQVFITTSSDGGANWSTPALVNSGNTAYPAFTPALTVASDGTVGVSYYQWDAAPSSGAEPTTLYLQQSASPGSSSTPPTFGAPTAVSGEFNGLAAPWAGGYFLGDYEGLAASSSGFVPFAVLTTCNDGSNSAQPTCSALQSVLNPTDLTPTKNNATDVYAFPGS